MQRRRVLGLAGAIGLSTLWPEPRGHAGEEEGRLPSSPPRLNTQELARRVRSKGFDPNSLYAHELVFRAEVLIRREVPLLLIMGMPDRFGFNRAHLYGGGSNMDVGSVLIVTGLIVDHGYGALMIWQRECKYADA